MKASLEATVSIISKWLKGSGLKVNDNKTEGCLFSRRDMANISVTINEELITTKEEITVLSIIFDYKLQWGPQVAKTILKAAKALKAIRMIKHYNPQTQSTL